MNFFKDDRFPIIPGTEIYQLLGAITHTTEAKFWTPEYKIERIRELLMDYAEVCPSKVVDEAFGKREEFKNAA